MATQGSESTKSTVSNGEVKLMTLITVAYTQRLVNVGRIDGFERRVRECYREVFRCASFSDSLESAGWLLKRPPLFTMCCEILTANEWRCEARTA